LIKICSNFAILVSKQSKMAKQDEQKQIEFLDDYSNEFKNNSNLSMYLKNLIEENSSSKCIVYTFDSVTKPIELNDLGDYEQIQIGEIEFEKDLNDRLANAYASKAKKIIILRLDSEKDRQHLSLIKFLLDKIELENNDEFKLQVCIIIHLNLKIDKDLDKQLSLFNLSYLSGWDQIMLDSLDDKMFEIVDYAKLSLKEIIL